MSSQVTTPKTQKPFSSSPSLPRPHPHAGARDSNGSWGYVADVTLVRRFVVARYELLQQEDVPWNHTSLESHLYLHNTKEWEAVCNTKPREGKERKAGWRLLTQKVQVNGPDPDLLSNSNNKDSNQISDRYPRILCAIYTYEKREEMISAIAETWGWKCDGFFAASTHTIHAPMNSSTGTFHHLTQPIAGLGSVDIPHLGPEQYDNMWRKTRSILAYMHDYYLKDFDFFFLSGDDTYVIVENLRRTLQSLGTAAWDYPLYLGHWIPFRPGANPHNMSSSQSYFVGGGPGYVLNRKSLEALVQRVLPTCQPDRMTSSEDRILGECFRSIGIVGNHSVDGRLAQRFHGMDPHDTCTMTGESGYFGTLYRFWGSLYGFRTGFNLTSSQSVSFHRLTTSKHLKRIHAILYKSCPPNTTLGNILGSS